MEIKIEGGRRANDSEKIRLRGSTSDFPVALDISTFAWGSALQALFYTFPPPKGPKQRVEIRKKENMICVFIMQYEDTVLEPYWKDSELIWELK